MKNEGKKMEKKYMNIYIYIIYLYIFTYFENKPLINYL